MKAMIFAAGMGTRLKPLTDNCPKALVNLGGEPLLEHIIVKLADAGFDELIINVHHFAPQVILFLKQKNNFGIHIEISDESDLLLDTGGGLKKASWFLREREPFLVHNVDIFTDFNLKELYNTHLRSGALATLAVKNRNTSRSLLFNNQNQLTGWRNNKTGETRWVKEPERNATAIAFSGIQVINPGIFEFISENGVFSIIDVYLRLAAQHPITAYNHDDSVWMDLGTVENLQKAENYIQSSSYNG
jgi:NDP-sugar pyrophosphorylase family protein